MTDDGAVEVGAFPGSVVGLSRLALLAGGGIAAPRTAGGRPRRVAGGAAAMAGGAKEKQDQLLSWQVFTTPGQLPYDM